MEIIETCIPIVVGAFIAIVPTMIEKQIDRKNIKEKKHETVL